jgi:hypothetical protein
MTCLLIRKLYVCVLFEINGDVYGYTYELPSARGALEGETLVECKTDSKGPW